MHGCGGEAAAAAAASHAGGAAAALFSHSAKLSLFRDTLARLSCSLA